LDETTFFSEIFLCFVASISPLKGEAIFEKSQVIVAFVLDSSVGVILHRNKIVLGSTF
jgi:hypothetical protein